jgi:hypothetical protein
MLSRPGAPVAAVTALFATEPLAGISVGASVFGDMVCSSPIAHGTQMLGLAAFRSVSCCWRATR